jgi:hypothetical protein
MEDIYKYNDDFSADVVINDINVIAEELDKERRKPYDERSADRERELIYAQFIRGLRLSTGMGF